MMRTAYFGTNAMILMAIHGLLFGLDLAGIFPYVATLFYPMFVLIALMIAVVGFFQKDEVKWPAIVGGLIAVGMLVYWVIALVARLNSM